jgi:hypothetical protein
MIGGATAPPGEAELKATLGGVYPLWTELRAQVAAMCAVPGGVEVR